MSQYNFDNELEALRIRVNAESSIEYGRFQHPNFETVKPLVILMENFLLGLGVKKSKQRKIFRVRMLALWTQQKVESSYDLTIWQCSTILDFLEHSPEKEITERAERFLEDSAHAVESPDCPLPIQADDDLDRGIPSFDFPPDLRHLR